MRFNFMQVATLAAAFLPATLAWNLDIYKTKDCSGNPSVIYGDVAGVNGCLNLEQFSVDLYGVILSYDDEQHHTVTLYEDFNCKCEIKHALTCPGAQVLHVGQCTTDPFGKRVKSLSIRLNGSSG